MFSMELDSFGCCMLYILESRLMEINALMEPPFMPFPNAHLYVLFLKEVSLIYFVLGRKALLLAQPDIPL